MISSDPKPSHPRILITGGAGFIGSNLAKIALESNFEVTIIDDLSTGYASNLTDMNVRFVQASILDIQALKQAMQGVDSVVHLAALGSVPRSIKDPEKTHAVNATGTLNVLEAMRTVGIRHLIFSSSSSVYGLNPALPKGEREWVRPLSPYAVTKLAAEQYVLAYQESFGLQTLAFRFFNVYGPGQRTGHSYAAVIPAFLQATLNDQPLRVNGDGTNSRDFTYVGTVCRILIDALTRRVQNAEPVNLAFGTSTTLNQLVRAIANVRRRDPQVIYGPSRPGDVPHSQADNKVLKQLFPSIEPVALNEGLVETLAWFECQ